MRAAVVSPGKSLPKQLRWILLSLVGGLGAAVWLGRAEASITFLRGALITLNGATSNGIQAIAVADLNHDGKADIIAVQPGDNAVAVYINDGTGAFPNLQTLPTAQNPVAVVTGDFNKDGIPDLAIVANDVDKVSVYMGDGSGNFVNPHDWDVDPAPVGIAAADFNGDGNTDLAVLSNSSIRILKSNGDGTFTDIGSIPTGRGQTSAVAIVAGHLNSAHNYVDLAVSNATTVTAFFNNGDGTFATPAFAATGLASPQGLAIGEFDGDTHAADNNPDIAVINGNDINTTVTILQGNGAGQFTAYDTNTAFADAECGATALVAVDLDGDGKQDLAVGSAGDLCGTTGQIQLYCQQTSAVCADTSTHAISEAGGFQIQPLANARLGDVSALQSGDINGDGRPDLVAVEFPDLTTIKILLNVTGVGPTDTPAPATPTGTPAASPTSTRVLSAATPTVAPTSVDSNDSCAISPAHRHDWTWAMLPAIWIGGWFLRRSVRRSSRR